MAAGRSAKGGCEVRATGLGRPTTGRKENELTRLAAVLALVIAVAALAASAAQAQAAPPKIGVVDMTKVLEGYKEFQESDKIYKDFLRERQEQLQDRMSVSLLSETELKEYQNIKAATAPTQEQKQRLEQLKAVADARQNELDTLSRAATTTDAQKQRLAELRAMSDKSSADIAQLQQRISDEIAKRNKELSENLNKKIEAALSAIAADKHLDYILAKDAVLFGGTDVTADVLTRLNPAPAR
jgi:Skp family chaperone for outer membrane proteins